jgi:flagellar protein FlaG
MGIQVASLPAGSVLAAGNSMAAVAPRDLSPGKKIPLPGESNAANEKIEASLPGSRGSNAPDLRQAAAELQHISMAFNRRLKFVIDQESREIFIKVIDNETDKVIKVLPPEELQRLHSRIRETIGFLFDQMA